MCNETLVLELVFNYLDSESLNSVRSVCKLWHDISEFYWWKYKKYVTITPTNNVQQYLYRCKNIEKLTIDIDIDAFLHSEYEYHVDSVKKLVINCRTLESSHKLWCFSRDLERTFPRLEYLEVISYDLQMPVSEQKACN